MKIKIFLNWNQLYHLRMKLTVESLCFNDFYVVFKIERFTAGVKKVQLQ